MNACLNYKREAWQEQRTSVDTAPSMGINLGKKKRRTPPPPPKTTHSEGGVWGGGGGTSPPIL